MGKFSRVGQPTPCKDCKNPCKERFQKRQALIQAAKDKAASEPGEAATEAAATADRFAKYNKAMPRAKAAEAVYSSTSVPCLRRITDPKELKKMGLDPSDLRDDKTGFHAEVYQSEADGSTILAFQGTDPTSLNDWKTNIMNGAGKWTGQYAEAAMVASRMAQSGVPFDITGHSLGGGLAQNGGLFAPGTDVTIFNSAGLPDAALERAGASSFDDLDSRTTAFRSEDELLTGVQEDKDPQHQLDNAKYLRNELTGDAGTIDPLQISGYNSETVWWNKEYDGHYKAFFDFVDDMIRKAEADVAAGKDPKLFPSARGEHVDVPGKTFTSRNVSNRLSRLNQHTMGAMIAQMEVQKSADEAALRKYTGIKN